jgi:hypothetical protein
LTLPSITAPYGFRECVNTPYLAFDRRFGFGPKADASPLPVGAKL